MVYRHTAIAPVLACAGMSARILLVIKIMRMPIALLGTGFLVFKTKKLRAGTQIITVCRQEEK